MMLNNSTPPEAENTPEARPLWLVRAWKVRATLLTLVMGLMTAVLYARWTASEGRDGTMVLLAGGALIVVALACDWAWLKRNHHRVNEWGLSKGKDARKKKK